jgi:hypothetical protein
MRNPFSFFSVLNKQPFFYVLWVYYLVALNLASGLFWNRPLAKAIFFTFIVSASSIIGLYAVFGFSKIMGLGHVYWLPLLFYLFPQTVKSSGGYRNYLVVLTISICISLVFDIVDVWIYLVWRQ